jgi:hypothetical protein
LVFPILSENGFTSSNVGFFDVVSIRAYPVCYFASSFDGIGDIPVLIARLVAIKFPSLNISAGFWFPFGYHSLFPEFLASPCSTRFCHYPPSAVGLFSFRSIAFLVFYIRFCFPSSLLRYFLFALGKCKAVTCFVAFATSQFISWGEMIAFCRLRWAKSFAVSTWLSAFQAPLCLFGRFCCACFGFPSGVAFPLSRLPSTFRSVGQNFVQRVRFGITSSLGRSLLPFSNPLCGCFAS